VNAESPLVAASGPPPLRDTKPIGKDRITLTPAEVVEYYRVRVPQLSQRGRNWRGPCALHRGKRASLSVEQETGRWFCHSKCGHGGSIFDFEMLLTGADFKMALASVYAIVGRPLPERARMTRDELRTAQEAIIREQRERQDAEHFASAAMLMLEGELERLPADSPERRTWTRILDTLRTNPVAVLQHCKDNDANCVAAWVCAGREYEQRVQLRLAYVIMQMASEDVTDAA